jgi:hypothetical protein
MANCSNSIRRLRLVFGMTLALCLFGAQAGSAAQNANGAASTIGEGGYRIAGTVVSKTDRRALARARVTIREEKDRQKFQTTIASEDGKYEFDRLPAGKYSLSGAKRGFISASYDQHDQYSTAIVTGAGLDTENLALRLAPDALIAGKVLDEAGDPVRHAMVMLYYDDHSSGVDQIRQANSAQTNDLGEYEMTPLRPGTYFLSVTGKPWYAVHPHSDPAPEEAGSQGEATPSVDRSLDVAYPVTYYPDVTDVESALPIPIQGGERVQADLHLTPVPSLRLLLRVPDAGNNGFFVPQFVQPAFNAFTHFQTDMTRGVSPGLVEVTGIPAGRYDVNLFGPAGQRLQMNGVDITKDGEQIDLSKSDALSSVRVLAQVRGEPTLPPRLSVGLRSGSRVFTFSQSFDSKGTAELSQVPVGRYEVVVWGEKPYSIAHISAEGAEVSGHSLIVVAGSSPAVSLTLVAGSAEVQGIAKKAGKAFAGAMVVLVPKDAVVDRDLFRRDQSDLDGTFVLHTVVPGSYTLLAIEDGWDLDWSQPGVIGAYLKRGQKVEVGNQGMRPIDLAEAIEVQSK